MRRPADYWLAVLVASLTAAAALGADGPSFVVRAKAVYPVTADQPGPLMPGVVVVRDGAIAAVGDDSVALPDDLPVYEYPDGVICPGFIDAASGWTGPHEGLQTVSGAYRAADAFQPYADYTRQLAMGITTAHLTPGTHRLVSGRGAIARLHPDPTRRLMRRESDLVVNFDAFGPPEIVDRPFFASADVEIQPARRQRPSSRYGQLLEMRERIADVGSWAGPFNYHQAMFAEAWRSDLPLRVLADTAADLQTALEFIRENNKAAYLVGGRDADLVLDEVRGAGVPIVLRLGGAFRAPAGDLGPNPAERSQDPGVAGVLAQSPLKVALAGRSEDGFNDPRLAAALAWRGGMSQDAALAGVTRVAAEVLGIDETVGSLAPGKAADLVVLTGDPLDVNSHVQRVFVGGSTVFEAPESTAVVVRGGTIWTGAGSVIEDGAVLIENGKIQAVGHRVPHPPHARLIDAGPSAYLTPGFIDAHGHLGVGEAERGAAVDAEVRPEYAIGTANHAMLRVARNGVTTVLLAPRRVTGKGGRITAIKTWGETRDDLVARAIAGIKFVLDGDPLLGAEPIDRIIEAGKKYEAEWKKYEEALRKWEQARKQGKEVKPEKEEEPEEEEQGAEPDPITGVWEFVVTGDPLPEPLEGKLKLRLTGNRIEGRVTIENAPDEAKVTGTLDGDQVRLEIDDEGESPMGPPVIEARLEREDFMAGYLKIGDAVQLNFQADRTEKGPVEFKVTRRRTRRDDGRPQPPQIKEELEPIRKLLKGEAAALVEVRSPAQIKAVLELLVDKHELPTVLLNAEEAGYVVDEIVKRKEHVGVVPPERVLRYRDGRAYVQAADLSRQGVPVALQSSRADGARSLPYVALYAVQQGLGGDAALRALTVDAARMFKLDDEIGTLQPGRDGDVLIFTGHPFDAGSRLERVIIKGREVPHE